METNGDLVFGNLTLLLLMTKSTVTFSARNIKTGIEEFKEVNDKRVLWDLNKYKIRQRTITYSKAKARKKREKVRYLEESLRDCTTKFDNNPCKENLEELECLQAEYDQLYDYVTQEAIIRSPATWYELGEKKQQIFLEFGKIKQEEEQCP